jgi:hypothetical protein
MKRLLTSPKFHLQLWPLVCALAAAGVLYVAWGQNRPALPLITEVPGSGQALVAVGAVEPAPEETLALADAFANWQSDGATAGTAALEGFIAKHPDSGWVPCLRSQLALHDRQHGRTTLALEHWEAAYDTLRPLGDDPTAKALTDEVLAHWTRLLAALGRREALTLIYAENPKRVLDAGPLTQMWLRTMEAYSHLVAYPEESYKCGAVVLARMAAELHGRRFDAKALLEARSPATGMTLASLAELARNLGIVAVDRGEHHDL